MEFREFLIVISSAGVLHSLFLGVYLFRFKKGNIIANKILALLLFALSIRIGKSVFYSFMDLPLYIRNIGLAANLMIGPLLLYYGKALLYRQVSFKRTGFLHFLPAGIYVMGCNSIPNATDEMAWYLSYSFILTHMLIYLLFSGRLLAKGIKGDGEERPSIHRVDQNWYTILVTGMSVLWLVYLLIFISVLPYYIVGALSYSFLIYILAYMALNRHTIFTMEYISEKYKDSTLSKDESRRYFRLIKKKIEEEKLYLDPDLTLASLGEEVGVAPREISQIVNEMYGDNFSSFINSYRIEEAKNRLIADKEKKYTISAIAFDCGFNSISSFNINFKSFTDRTPSQFRENHKLSSFSDS